MEIPTINIVMSFDPEEVFTFLESKTLDIFKDKSKSPKDTYFFRNGPASSFKSLVHSVGYEGESGTPKLEIEFVDPEELFEHRMTSFTVKGMIPEEGNLIEDQLKKLRRDMTSAAGLIINTIGESVKEESLLKELQNRKRSEDQDDASAKDLEARIVSAKALVSSLETEIEILKEAHAASLKIYEAAIDEKGRDGGGSIDYDKVSQLDKETQATIREYNESIFKRSIWISYGVGDLLENWCPPMVFDTAVGAEYTVGGKNARVLKLKYDGVSSRPTNTATSHFLSKLGARIVCKGTSGRILNASAMEAKKKYYNDLNTSEKKVYFPYFNHGLHFSIHEIITDVLTDYIRNASSNDNVLVVVPDLDILLLDKLTASMKSSGVNWFLRSSEKPKVATSYAEFAKVVKGLTSFFEDLGMQLTDRRLGVNVAGTLALKNREQEVTNPDEVPNYLQTNNFHISLTSDIGQDNHLEALEEVSNAISKAAIASYKGSNTAVPDESFNFKEYVVNDFVLLKALARKGLIPTASEPLYIFGTSKMVNDFVFGQIAFTTETGAISSISQVSGTINDALPKHIENAAWKIHPLDKIKGLDETYIKTMALYQDPSLAFSPFGFDAIRVNDIDVTTSDKIKNKFTVPIFSIGTRNSNVMNLKLDYNKNYLAALTSIKYSPDTRNTQITGIVDDSKVSAKIINVFTQFDDLNLDKVRQKDGAEWDKFKKLVDPYRDTSYRWWFGVGDQDKDAGDMLDIFEEISSPEAAETLKTALSERGGDDQEEYYDLMLTSLEALSLATPAQVVTTPVGKGTSSVVRATTLLFERLKKMAIIGTVKTLPLFQLSSMKRTINKPCLIYAVEPRFQGVKRHADAIKGPPFYTGMYTIAGFKHTISGNSAYSEFKINKAGTN